MTTAQPTSSPPGVANPSEPEQTVLVPIEKVVESKSNPRKYLDAARETELLESVKARGIVAPLLIRPVNGKMEIVEGARRYRAAKAAGLASVPSIVRSYSDDEAFEIQLISFTQRADIHPLDEAVAYEQFRKKGFDIAQIAAKVGKERSYIAKRLQLIRLIVPAKNALQEGEINLEMALEIACIPAEQQKEALEAAEQDFKTAVELRKYISSQLLLNLDSASFKKDDADLLPKVGPCTTCAKRSGNNPDLFGDISAKGNHCLDAACFGQKNRAWAEQRKEELAAEGKTVVDITDEYSVKKGSKAVGTKDYSVVDKKRANAYGIFVDGPEKGKLVPIKLAEHAGGRSSGNPNEAKAPVHHLSPAEMKQRFERRMEIWQNKIEQLTRQELYKRIIAHVRWPLSRKEFELIFPDLVGRWGQATHDEYIQTICAAAGISPPKSHYSLDLKEWAEKLAPKVTDQQICQLVLAAVLYSDLILDPSYVDDERRKMDALLKVHKSIDEKTIRMKATDNLLPKKPKPPKVEEPVKKSAKKSKPKAKPAGKKKSKK